MFTNWNYTNLASFYTYRPDYAPKVIDQILSNNEIEINVACDIGAGTGHLSKELLLKNINVVAVEPNDEMRKIGIERFKNNLNISWIEGSAEKTNIYEDKFDLITFGSSFNVCDRLLALQESHRIGNTGAVFACIWNHRNLNDPLQMEIENLIKKFIPNYNYGSRRENQSEIIRNSNYFKDVLEIKENISYRITNIDFFKGWKSHATLERQAGSNFSRIIDGISVILNIKEKKDILVPYTTVAYKATKV